MSSEQKISVCCFKLEEQKKRRFAAAMAAEGTTLSERVREWISEFLGDEELSVDHPQLRLELKKEKTTDRNSR